MRLPYVLDVSQSWQWPHYWLVTVPRLEEPVGLICVLVPAWQGTWQGEMGVLHGRYGEAADRLERLIQRSKDRTEHL